ncbi:hypothetical protein HKD37_02G004354 [Glycine soja]
MCHLSLCWYSIFCKHNFLGFVFVDFCLFVEVYIAFAWFWIYHIFHLELAGLSNFMGRIPDKIKSIDGSKETLKLTVRITDLWFIGTPNKSKQAKMVFVDSEGDQIHAVCKSDQLKSWKANFKENSTYVMHNFKVVKNDGQFRVCEHVYKLFFIGVTVIREADLHELPFKEFRFVEFGNVVAGNFVADLLILLGSLIRCSFGMFHKKIPRLFILSRILFVTLHDGYVCLILMNGEILSCTLWENYCMQFLSYLNERGNDGPMVIILTHARIKDAHGSYLASVSNSFKVSKLLINEPILEIQEFKESQLSSKDAFLSKVEVKTISEINGISKDVVCVTMGTISKIVMDNHSWCYPACIQCHRKNDIQTGPFTCGCGKDNDQPDRECAELIGQTANEVNRVKIEDGDLDLNASPQALDKLLGYVLAFKVRIQSKFKNVIVLRYSNELDLINDVLEMLADSETCSKIDASNVDCNNATHPECNYQHAKISNSAKARINRKRIMQQKRHPHAQSSSQPTTNCTSEYDIITSDSSESVNSESTQGLSSNFLTVYEDCQSPTNQPVINTEGYSDLGDQLMQCRYCNAQIQYSRIKSHIVLALTHMLDQHNSYAKSFRMVRDRLADDQADNIKLQLIAARGKDGRVYNMPNIPEIVALIVGDFHPGSKRDIIVETQNGELQRIHELHPSYLPLQYPLLFPYGEDGYRADILHRYTMVESERLSYIRNNQKKLRVDKYSSLQSSLDTGTAKGLTKGKRVILPSTLLSPLNLKPTNRPDIVSRIFILKYEQMLLDLTKGQLLGKINDDTLRNLTLIEIEQILHINQRSLKDYPTMPYPQDINLISYLQNNLNLITTMILPMNTDEQKTIYDRIIQAVNNNEGGMFFLYGFGGTGKTFMWRTLASSLRAENQIVIIVASSGIASLLLPGGRTAHSRFKIPVPIFEDSTCNIHQGTQLAELLNQTITKMAEHVIAAEIISGKNIGLTVYIPRMSMSPSQSPWPFKLLRRKFPIMLSYAMTINKVNSAKGIKILIHDDEQKSMNSTTNVVFKEVKTQNEYHILHRLKQIEIQLSNLPPIQLQQHRGRYFLADGLADFRADLKIYEFIIINFFACDDNSILDIHFTPPLDQQTCGRPILHSRQHIWTTEITQCILGAPHPLEIPLHARKYLKEYGNRLTILRKHGPPLQWDVVTLDAGIKDKSVVRPWYKFLKENDFHHGDEVSFYYRPHEKIWEIVIIKERK